MRIAAIDHSIPSRRLSNDDVLEAVRRWNADAYDARGLSDLQERVSAFLTAAGTETRYCLDDDERAIDHVLRAARDAIRNAEVEPDEIDFVIYTGVGRGWLEPATANAVQAALGLANATCFDVLDACASWLRALQIAHDFLASGRYRTGLIVNCECGFYRRYAECWRLPSVDAVAHLGASFTVGEAATATVVLAEERPREFYFTFKTLPQHLELCLLPLAGFEDFLPGPPQHDVVAGRFLARSVEMFTIATRRIVQSFLADPRLSGGKYDACFGHSPSEKVCEFLARRLDLERIFFPTHRHYGNTVSASIPLAMSLAVEQNRLHRDDRVLVIVGSAGITLGFATFVF